MHSLKIIPLLLIGFLIASCAKTPEKLYKDFYTIQAHKKVGVVTDVTILQDGPKKVDILLPELSKKYDKILNSHAMSQMKAKGYSVSSEYISTGLNVPVGAQVFVSTNRAAKTGERITGAHMIKRRGSTPSKIQKYSTEHLFERLMHRSVLSTEAPKTHFPEIKDLGIPKNHYILVVSGLTRNVNASKQIAQGALIAAVSLGTFVAWESDTAKIQVALIDVNTGKIVWANEVIAQAGDPHFIQKKMTKLFEKMPPYGSVKTKS
jgi:hypothetical protein